MKSNKFEQRVGRITIVVVIYTIVFLIVDHFSIPFLSSRSQFENYFPPHIYRQPKPYVMYGGTPNHEELNDLGYRGEEPTLPKPKGEFRIFVLGGSTVFNGKPPIPTLLEEKFKENGYDQVKVYNFAAISSVSRMELIRILLEVSNYKSDLNILYNGGNDILSPFYWDPRPGYPFNFVVYEHNPLLESNIKTYPAISLFLYGSNILRTFFPAYFTKRFVPLKKIQEDVKWLSDEWKEKIAEVYVENISKAHQVSSVYSSKCLTIFQPLIYYKDHLSEDESKILKRKLVEKGKEFAVDIRGKIKDKINAQMDGEKINFYDLSNIFDASKKNVFVDHIHITQESKSTITDRIYDIIINSSNMFHYNEIVK